MVQSPNAMSNSAVLFRVIDKGSFDGDEELALYLEMRTLARLFMTRHVTINIQSLLTALWERSACDMKNVRFPDASKILMKVEDPNWLTNNDFVLRNLFRDYFDMLQDELSEFEAKVIAKTTRMLLACVFMRENKVSVIHVPRVYGVIFGDSLLETSTDTKRRR